MKVGYEERSRVKVAPVMDINALALWIAKSLFLPHRSQLDNLLITWLLADFSPNAKECQCTAETGEVRLLISPADSHDLVQRQLALAFRLRDPQSVHPLMPFEA